MTFSLATWRVDDRPTPVLTVEDRSWALADVAPDALQPDPARGLMNVFDHWERTEPLLLAAAERLADGTDTTAALPVPAALEDVLTPLQYPRKIVLTGANYYDHMKNDGGHTDWEKDTKIPVFFLKPPTTTLVGPGRTVRYPDQSEKFDYEIELAVVIGRRGRKLTLDNAMEHVAGYTIAIDLSARDWQRHPKHLVKFDLFGGKAFDDSCPLGPAIVPARFVDEDNLRLRFWLNGEPKQDANTRDMIWSIPEQLVKITEHMTLEPGDIVSTGTPAGVGLGTGQWMKPGDLMEGEITGLGRLTAEIVKDQ
ncbi:fumarylacetoacetate hydrolase family protein [Streptomyces sp. WI04-05B]|uniref:fumarylacetoacetate hydrolase family protein n=1 Tax=Streptomyces TaxID=1883 RepID=UPI0029B031B2|nr:MULTISPECIES: fumarylacetoacetate hydrolase family protein [unclassified Streptomyces]MDX2546953.1 fumarylacetoacetate hydrolase family protein [Streptomyces sp. WI04-05B]MDX2589337.1 fumarylacetoacetate hydrolase family protein [Streptomyces sp. WI04-05A]